MNTDNLTRKEKLQLLQAIKDGKIPTSVLRQKEIYLIYDSSDMPGIYKIDGKEYDQAGYEKLIEEIKGKNPGAILWHESKTYDPVILHFRPCPGCEPIIDEG